MTPMDAVILAGGLGTRLRAAVSDVPKCMAPVAGKPFLHYLFGYLSRHGVRRVVLSLGYMHEVVERWAADSPFGMEIDSVVEPAPLGTGGAIKLALDRVESEHALILNGDTLFNADLSAFMAAHLKGGAQLSMALKPMKDFDRYGNVSLDGDGYITGFFEKQYCAEGRINGGCYIVDAEIPWLDAMPEKFSFETDVLQPHACGRGIYGYEDDGYFIDIGVPEDYARAERDFATMFI